MRHIESTDSLKAGMVILTGGHFYRVTDVFPRKFRGHVWEETRKAWGESMDIPLPSPCAIAQVVTEAPRFFPGL